MSTVISHDPRHYGRRAINGILRNPPECSCTATLIDRKFVAASGPPPPVDARRLARTLTGQTDSSRIYDLCAYPDLLVFHPLSRGPGLTDIPYDDIIQIEMIYGKENLLFILCGRRGNGTYYFFKLSDEFVGERIIAMASRAYPGLNNSHPAVSFSRSFPQKKFGGQSSPSESTYESDTPFACNRFGRERSAPPSASFSSSSGDIYARPTKNVDPQNSFIRWEGYHRNRNRSQGRQPRGLSAPKRAASVRVLRSPSRSRASGTKRNGSEEALFIKAQGRGPMRRRQNSVKGYKYKKGSPPNRKQSRPRKASPRVKPKTFILQPSFKSNFPQTANIPRDYDDSIDSELSFDPANEFRFEKHHYPNVATIETTRYGGQNGKNYNDWKSTDSWGFPDGRAASQRRMNIYKNSDIGVSRGERNVADDISNSSEDSLYFEREQEMASSLPNHWTNYLPDIH
ncbi:unnamed protein product [Hymenolepis diminuta]|uniref:Uncharacterized protein n=1 Tax=Hymenolepis diminuta TaxID=6216 RepID=A0A564Y6Y6_HYMDI|nr:unnamed protein product [Hymenolepis diminuta]